MKLRHLVSTFVTAVGAIATIGIVTAQPEAGENQRTVIRGQSVQLSGTAAAGDVVFIGRDPTQPLTEEEAAAFETRQVFLQTADGIGFQHEVFEGTPGTPATQVMGWHTGASGGMNQFIKVNGTGDDLEISLNFMDTPLPMILEPLANMAVNGGMPAFGIASFGAAQGMAGTGQVFTQRITQGNMAGAHVADAVVFHSELREADVHLLDAPVPGVAPTSVAFTSKLVIEDEADRERLVSVEVENVSIQEALEIIGAEANCNIFLEDDAIVVNSCAN